jgi:mRNA interferase HigB
VRVISRGTLRDYWENNRRAEVSLKAWFKSVDKAQWSDPADIKRDFSSASFVGRDRVVFNIAGNNYRLVVAIAYDPRIVFVKWIGTHAEYDKINVEEV